MENVCKLSINKFHS